MHVLRAAVLFVLCASCGMVETAPSSPRTLAVSVPVTNEDQILLAVHYTTACSDEFRAFARAFWEQFPAVYQRHCPESHCFTEPRHITLEEFYDTGRGYRMIAIAVWDGRQEPIPVGSFVLERGRNPRLSAHGVAIWTIKRLLRSTSR